MWTVYGSVAEDLRWIRAEVRAAAASDAL